MADVADNEDHKHYGYAIGTFLAVMGASVAAIAFALGVSTDLDTEDIKDEIIDIKEAHCRELTNVEKYAECVEEID